MKPVLLFSLLSLFIIVGCRSLPVVVRNYEYAPTPNCDCSVKSLLTVASINKYVYKRSAFCNRGDYDQIRDSIHALTEQMYAEPLPDSLERLDALLKIEKSKWTHCKILVKEKKEYLGMERDSVLKAKLRIRYYNNNKLFFKKMGKEKFKDGVLVKSTLHK